MLHMGENVESLWHAKTENAKKSLENEKWWVVLELLRIYNMRHQDPPKYYTKEVESLTVGKLAWQFSDHDRDSILYGGEVINFWTMALELLCKVNVGSRIDLATARRQMQIDHVRWDEPLDCQRSKIMDSIKSVQFFLAS